MDGNSVAIFSIELGFEVLIRSLPIGPMRPLAERLGLEWDAYKI